MSEVESAMLRGAGGQSKEERRRLARERLRNPGPHAPTSRTYAWAAVSVLGALALWFVSMATYSSEPSEISPAAIDSGQGVQVTVQAATFNTTTAELGVRLKMAGTGGLTDSRGMLTRNLEVRVADDEGVRLIELAKGDPLSAEIVPLEMDGNVDKYPFDKYSGEFSVLVEGVEPDGTLVPIPTSVGTAKAETGWYTKYEVDPTGTTETKVSVVSMKREPFIVSFAVLLALLMFLIAAMALAVGVLCVTNRRQSDAGMVGWIVALLFALPFVRRILPGDPPIGCLLDVSVFAWALLLCVVSMLLAMVAWLRQSHAMLSATPEV